MKPSHCLIGRGAGFQPHVSDKSLDISDKNLSEQEIVRERQLNHCWKMWSDDDLKNLPPVVKGFKADCNLRKGSLVLVREDNVPRMRRPLGILIDLFPGRDGVVRCVSVQTTKGTMCRSVQKLHDLEIFYDTKDGDDLSSPAT